MTRRARPARSGPSASARTKAYVLDDTQVYGKGLARAWALHANKIGLTVVSPNGGSEGFDAAATDYAALAQKIKASGADVIYIGSITGQNTGKLWKDLRAALPDFTIMSGDGVFEKSWYDGAGTAGNGTYLTFGGVGPGPADRRRQDVVRRIQGEPQRQLPVRPTRPTATPQPRSLSTR